MNYRDCVNAGTVVAIRDASSSICESVALIDLNDTNDCSIFEKSIYNDSISAMHLIKDIRKNLENTHVAKTQSDPQLVRDITDIITDIWIDAALNYMYSQDGEQFSAESVFLLMKCVMDIIEKYGASSKWEEIRKQKLVQAYSIFLSGCSRAYIDIKFIYKFNAVFLPRDFDCYFTKKLCDEELKDDKE